jgi:uncharacterized membrane protein YfcA
MSLRTAAAPGSDTNGASSADAGGFALAWPMPISIAGVADSRTEPSGRERILRLAAIGTAAGAFSGLFGVGGGTIIVPLLIFWFGYGERLATGTSLAAIILIALFASLAQGIYGNVDLAKGALLSIPAVGGVVAGTALQQRLSQRMISVLFAVLLVVIAGQLILK